MVRLLYKAALVAATAVGAVAYVHTNPPDEAWISSLRAVRFGRAAYAVSHPYYYLNLYFLPYNICAETSDSNIYLIKSLRIN